jgi:hypothetical protein
MDSPEHERQHVVDYMAVEADDETVEHLEKVARERILGRDTDVWDVHTDKGRWWVITPPTNLYSQAKFPSMDAVLSFHAGLMARVEARQQRSAPAEQSARFPAAWRLWEQAGEALERAEEAHDFQAVGMRCRESLLAFAREASSLVQPPPDDPPKAADFNGWTELVANAIAAGPGAERRRGYLKASAKATWELVNWLTHITNAERCDAYFSHSATGHVLSSWTISVLRHESPDADRCPDCGSYRLVKEYDRSEGPDDFYAIICRVCGWTGAPEAERRIERAAPDPDEDLGPCVTIDVPLRGPTLPKPRSSD